MGSGMAQLAGPETHALPSGDGLPTEQSVHSVTASLQSIQCSWIDGHALQAPEGEEAKPSLQM